MRTTHAIVALAVLCAGLMMQGCCVIDWRRQAKPLYPSDLQTPAYARAPSDAAEQLPPVEAILSHEHSWVQAEVQLQDPEVPVVAEVAGLRRRSDGVYLDVVVASASEPNARYIASTLSTSLIGWHTPTVIEIADEAGRPITLERAKGRERYFKPCLKDQTMYRSTGNFHGYWTPLPDADGLHRWLVVAWRQTTEIEAGQRYTVTLSPEPGQPTWAGGAFLGTFGPFEATEAKKN